MEPIEKIKLHRVSDYHACIDPPKGAITVEPTEKTKSTVSLKEILGVQIPSKNG